MWRGQFVEFKKSAAGGFKSETVANAEWAQLKAQWEPNKDAFVYDLKSPEPAEPLRLRVVTEDLSIFRNEGRTEKAVEKLQPKSQFNDEDVEQMKRNTMKTTPC